MRKDRENERTNSEKIAGRPIKELLAKFHTCWFCLLIVIHGHAKCPKFLSSKPPDTAALVWAQVEVE